jgi:hydroxymethylpyrimidine/phosphomethylpyrimidine kinase
VCLDCVCLSLLDFCAGLLQAAAALVPDAMEQDASGTACVLAAALLPELVAGRQLHGAAAGALAVSLAVAFHGSDMVAGL